MQRDRSCMAGGDNFIALVQGGIGNFAMSFTIDLIEQRVQLVAQLYCLKYAVMEVIEDYPDILMIFPHYSMGRT
ncbi:hypothetical protein MOKP58_41780 [Mycobacterium avium subsp. hominissuis]